MTDERREGWHRFRLVEDGGLVAAITDSFDRETARREIDHYAVVYAQDGPVCVQERVNKRYQTLYRLASSPNPPEVVQDARS